VGDMTEVLRVFLCCTFWFVVCGFAQDSIAISLKDELVIRSFEDLYEPSAVVALQGQGIVIFEDDGSEMISLHSVVKDDLGLTLEKQHSTAMDLDVTDIEGAACGADGTVFAIASHSLTKKDQRRDKREQLVQLKMNAGMDIDLLGNVGMREAIVGELFKIDPALAERADDINIEGLCFSKAGDRLMIGLRAPLYKGKAIVLLLENPYKVTSDSFTAKFSAKPLLLDLGGTGVRALAYSDSSGEYFFVSEVETKKKKMRPRLWAWGGGKEHIAVRMDVPGLKKLKNIEGLTFFKTQGEDKVLFVCDDGNKKKKQDAHYAIVDMREIKEKEKN
jgi:hypothetical protein